MADSCGTASATSLTMVSVSVAAIAAIGTSVIVETNSPIAPTVSAPSGDVRRDGEQSHQAVGVGHRASGQQGQLAGREEHQPGQHAR